MVVTAGPGWKTPGIITTPCKSQPKIQLCMGSSRCPATCSLPGGTRPRCAFWTRNFLQISTGIFNISGIKFSQNSLMEDLVPIYRDVTPAEFKICPGEWEYGSYYTTMVIDSSLHLKWLGTRWVCNAFYSNTNWMCKRLWISQIINLSSFPGSKTKSGWSVPKWTTGRNWATLTMCSTAPDSGPNGFVMMTRLCLSEDKFIR